MISDIRRILNTHARGRIGVSVSGGSDSVCLLDCIVRHSLASANDILVINFEHGIRGKSSKSDSRFVVQLCKKYGLKLYQKSADIPALAQASGRGIEHEARSFRKAEYERLVSTGEVDKILLAHNRDDNTESVLMHIFRGCGLKGLVGMSECDGYIVRPLINTSKGEILDYLSSHGIAYVDDETNNQSDYTRNYLRNEILPLIRAKWNNVDGAIASLSKIASGAVVSDTQGIEVDGSDVLVQTDGINAHTVISALTLLGGDADYTKKHIDAVTSLADKPSGSQADLPHRITAIREYGNIRLLKKAETPRGTVPVTMGTTEVGGVKLFITNTNNKVEKGKLKLDYDAIEGACIRFRSTGDKFKSCGGHSKLLSDYLTDKKIPQTKRDRLPIIAKGSEVLAIFGVEISDKAKLTDKTCRAVEINIDTALGGQDDRQL